MSCEPAFNISIIAKTQRNGFKLTWSYFLQEISFKKYCTLSSRWVIVVGTTTVKPFAAHSNCMLEEIKINKHKKKPLSKVNSPLAF